MSSRPAPTPTHWMTKVWPSATPQPPPDSGPVATSQYLFLEAVGHPSVVSAKQRRRRGCREPLQSKETCRTHPTRQDLTRATTPVTGGPAVATTPGRDTLCQAACTGWQQPEEWQQHRHQVSQPVQCTELLEDTAPPAARGVKDTLLERVVEGATSRDRAAAVDTTV